MSLQCPPSPVYCTSAQQKQKSRNAAKVYRFGSPKLRDLLRQQCRIRLREARQSSYSKRREGLDFNVLLRSELALLEQDLNLQEEIYKELRDEFNEWFVEQLEEEESYLIDVGDDDKIICPICQKDVLEANTNHSYKCKCDASFFYAGDTQQLRSDLTRKIDLHEQQCMHTLMFFVEPQPNGANGSLNALCESCDYFCSL